MKLFTNVHEAVDFASSLGISSTRIATGIGMSKQNFNNKLKNHGSSFTGVHEQKINDFLTATFTGVHERLSQLFTGVHESEKATFTGVHEKQESALFTGVHELKKPVPSPTTSKKFNPAASLGLTEEEYQAQLQKEYDAMKAAGGDINLKDLDDNLAF